MTEKTGKSYGKQWKQEKQEKVGIVYTKLISE